MILILDNYDSFTYNLVQYVGSINKNIRVVKNDELTVNQIIRLNISHLIISPGPGNQSSTGIAIDLIGKMLGKIPILGICLGHQAIAHYFNIRIVESKKIMHGKISTIEHNCQSVLYNSIPTRFKATRYHSLVVERGYQSRDVVVTSHSDDGEIMSIEHSSQPVYGIQYHPEAVLTEYGHKIISNFLNIVV